jgi:hypothetical protein
LKNKHYFTKENEDAIIRYSKSTNQRERTDLYIHLIEPVFCEMVDKIIFTYKFTTLPDITSLREECKIWLVTILDKFEPAKGYKAFSYFSVITKNWFIHKVKKQSQQNKREIQCDNLPKNLEHQYMINNSEEYIAAREDVEFWNYLREEMSGWDNNLLKENEKKVLKAILILLENIDDIEIFNKKAFYLYLREITGFSTKQIVINLNKLRTKYIHFRRKWNDGNI